MTSKLSIFIFFYGCENLEGWNEIKQLVEWLSRKDDKLRYQAFLLLKTVPCFDDVYPFEMFQKNSEVEIHTRKYGVDAYSENTGGIRK